MGAVPTGMGLAVLATPPALLEGIAVPEPFRRRWSWPQRVQAGVLALALEDVQRTGRLAEEARAWFAAEDDARPFAFVAICASLGLDAGAVRRAVAARGPKPFAGDRRPVSALTAGGVGGSARPAGAPTAAATGRCDTVAGYSSPGTVRVPGPSGRRDGSRATRRPRWRPAAGCERSHGTPPADDGHR